MDSILSRITRVFSILRKAHGVYVVPYIVALFFGLLRTVVAVAMWLDHLFYPQLGKTQVKSPIVLVGNPKRSCNKQAFVGIR